MESRPQAQRHLLTALLDFLYPEVCASCGQGLEGERRGSFCLECWDRLIPLTPPWCAVCGIPYPGLREGETCGRCLIHSHAPVDLWRCAGAYQNVLREAIHVFKYQRRRRTTRALLEWMTRRMKEDILADLSDVDMVVPVPLHRLKLRERGMNQAALMAKRVARLLGKPVWEGLARKKATAPQSELTRAERFVNVRNAFELRRPEAIRDRTILIVDDIVTTGATVEAAARVLKRGGARAVKVFALARSL